LLGLGFREHSTKPATSRWKRWPPVPASQPNFVGIDGVIEGLCPPYITDMDAAVDQVLEEKFGPGGSYADPDVFAQAYKDRASAAGPPTAATSGGVVDDDHAGRDRRRAVRRRHPGQAAGQHDRPDDRADAVHAHPAPVAGRAEERVLAGQVRAAGPEAHPAV